MEDKKALDITVMDLQGQTLIADFFVLCCGTSRVHIQAIADGIVEAMENEGLRCPRREGYGQARWVLLDYGDVVAHVFAQDEREYYNLEELWDNTREKLARKPENA